MEMMADVMNMPIRIHRSDQTCALGAAMFAATAGRHIQQGGRCHECHGAGLLMPAILPIKPPVRYTQKRYEQYARVGRFIEINTSY